jgi:signal transduction histidine kinase
MDMPRSTSEQLGELSDYLRTRQKQIMVAWRKMSDADPNQTTGRALTRGQFEDHVPEVLFAFERKIRNRIGDTDASAAGAEQKREEVKHGLHRWQQGYRLLELLHEWGHLQRCLFEELTTFAASRAWFEQETLAEANRQLIALVNETISESAVQYERMQQAESAGHMKDLADALATVKEIEGRRSALIHEAVHDIHGNVFGVTAAANLLGTNPIDDTQRTELAGLLDRGVKSVTEMLDQLMELARLEAGKEQREIVEFDAASLITELGNLNRPLAQIRGLSLETKGPPRVWVKGDPTRVRRLAQNLLLNALKYTSTGGVTLSWGMEKENWWLVVKDTGPGMLAGPGAPMVVGLKEATASARESDVKAAAVEGRSSHVLTPPSGASTSTAQQHPGEGVGLSIVKRLCELLDASLEMASSAKTGTSFRIVFPLRYPEFCAAH